MKKRKILIFAIFFIFLFALKIDVVKANTDEYTIDKYNIDIIVNENNTLDITEKITADFKINKHGIFRKIPIKNNVERLDGSTSKMVARIKDIDVSDKYTTYLENNYKVIKIGEADKTLTGEKIYVIRYTYKLGKDGIDDYDELYFDIIGTEWDTTISNVTFNIEMPKEFDKNKLGFSSGRYGFSNTKNIEFDVVGNSISGSYYGTLNEGEGLTVRLELPEGYFDIKTDVDVITILSVIIPITFVIIAFVIWKKFGKDDDVVQTVEFYPPEGYNSAEIGYMYKGEANNNDIVSLIVYLANKGYLKIVETEEKGLFKKTKEFKLIKLKEYDGNNSNEKKFFNGLFALAPDGKEVVKEDLQDRFYITMSKIYSDLNSTSNKKKIYDESSLGKRKWLILMILLTFILITYKPIYEYSDTGMLFMAIIFPCIGFTVLFLSIFSKNILVKTFGILFGCLFGGISFVTIILPFITIEPIYLVIYIIGIICSFFLAVFTSIMLKRNAFGNEILGKIKGFKLFLESAEKEKLEAMVMQDPQYFYNILPYTYVLGVSDKWIKKFETISIQQPTWYESSSPFDVLIFGNYMNSTMTSMNSVMSSTPSSNGDGGFSGGGFSGGGSGGGGGGSW